VSDQNNSQLKSGKDSTQSTNLPVLNTSTYSAVMANEGDRPPNQSKGARLSKPTIALMVGLAPTKEISAHTHRATHQRLPAVVIGSIFEMETPQGHYHAQYSHVEME